MGESNRITELKQLKKLANTFLDYYHSEQKIKTKGWEKDLIKRNIALLTQTIQKININLHPEKVSEYLQAMRYSPSVASDTNGNHEENLKTYSKHFSTIIQQGNIFFLLMKIIRCSPRISYFNDLTWFKHGSANEHIEYGLGNTDETVFEKYLPYEINRIQELEKTFFQKEFFKDDFILVQSILPLIKEEKYIPANILIITLTEGLVRKFCCLVLKNQNPEKSDNEINSSVYIGKSSFEALIRETTWKNDIPVAFSEFVTEYAHTENQVVSDFEKKFMNHKAANRRIKKKLTGLQTLILGQIKNQNLSDGEIKKFTLKCIDDLRAELVNLMTVEDKTVLIGLDVYLDFLIKKFKDDRNNIIHGKYSLFKEKWKTLVYLTALETLINKITWYEEKVVLHAGERHIT